MSDRVVEMDGDNIKNKIHIIACESVYTQVRKLNNRYP